MHCVAYLGRAVKQGDFVRILDKAHLDHGAYQRLRSVRASLLANAVAVCRRDSNERSYLDGVVPARYGQPVHAASGSESLRHVAVESCIRSGVADPCAGGKRGDAGHGARPDYVVNLVVVGIDRLRSGFQIQHCGKARLVYAEVIQPVAVLAPLVGIVAVLGGGVHVAQENDQTFFAVKQRAQPVAPFEIFVHDYLNFSYCGIDTSVRSSLTSSLGQTISTSFPSITIKSLIERTTTSLSL